MEHMEPYNNGEEKACIEPASSHLPASAREGDVELQL